MSGTSACRACGRRVGRAGRRHCSTTCRGIAARRDHERWASEPVVVLSEERLAHFAGVCPLCGRGIAAKRSRIVAIVPSPPRAGVIFDEDRGYWRAPHSTEPIRMHARSWAHSRCATLAEGGPR